MTGWEKNAHRQGGEGRGEKGRGGESPAPTSLRRKLWAQLLPRLLPPVEPSLALGEPVSSWQSLLEEELPHPVTLRVELAGEFREPQARGH